MISRHAKAVTSTWFASPVYPRSPYPPAPRRQRCAGGGRSAAWRHVGGILYLVGYIMPASRAPQGLCHAVDPALNARACMPGAPGALSRG